MTHLSEEQSSRIALGLFLFTLVALVLIPLALMLWCHFEPLQILQKGDAGRFHTVTTNRDLSNVTTSIGVVTVEGGFSAMQGQSLFVRTSNKDGLQLCAAGTPEHCAPVSGTWVGPMDPVPHARHWYVANLSGVRKNLVGMLAMGLVTAFFTGFATLALAAKGDRDDAAHPPRRARTS